MKRRWRVTFEIDSPVGFSEKEIEDFVKYEIGVFQCTMPHDDLEFANLSAFSPSLVSLKQCAYKGVYRCLLCNSDEQNILYSDLQLETLMCVKCENRNYSNKFNKIDKEVHG